ncbi:MAG: branched-chain amino acid ABC transporter ATP-binding protein/permease [Actinomycetota bacterium]
MNGSLATPRRLNIALTFVLCIFLPPLTARAMPKWFTGTAGLNLTLAVGMGIAALSLNVLLGYAGQISLGHAALLGSGAFTSALITHSAGLPIWIGIPVGGVVAAAIAFVVGLPALRLRGLYLALITIAFGLMMQQSVFRANVFSHGSAGIVMPKLFWGKHEFSNPADFLAVALVFLVVLWLFDINIVRTKLGRAFKAIREDEAVAQAYGIDVTRYKLLAFVLSGAFAGIAGAIIGYNIGFVNNETFGLDKSLLLVIMVVVGGLGSRRYVFSAAIAFTMIPLLITGLKGWDLVVGPIALILTIARHPGGFASAVVHRKAPTVEVSDELPKLPAPTSMKSSTAEVVLEAKDVSVRFGGLQALSNASLSVPRGKIIGLIGPNGAGKSTMFNAISGLVRTSSGTVSFLGADVTGLRPDERARMGIARSFQNIGLAKSLSVLENFMLAQHQSATYQVGRALLYTHNVSVCEDELRDRGLEAIDALGFQRYRDTPVRNLSHGQQRIVEIGCLLASAPELVMLDEPSAGMSPGAAENLATRLADLRDALGRTVLLIEHNVPMVLDLCDEIYVLDHGELLAHGVAAEIASHPEVVGAYLGASR